MKKIISLIVLFMVIFVMAKFSSAARRSKDEFIGKDFYIQSNMWNEKGRNILSVNYHQGEVIPVGTEVVIDKMGGTKVIFTVKESGNQYVLVLSKKHTRLNIFGLADRYFGIENPLEGFNYQKMNKKEQTCVSEGYICQGMSKEAVIMSYGFPPTHRTPSLDGDIWNYWQNRSRRIEIRFKDDKVTGVKGWKFSCEEIGDGGNKTYVL